MSKRALQREDRALDDAALDAATAHYASAREVDQTQQLSTLVFRLGGEWLGIPTSLLERIADPTIVHSLPHRRAGTTAGLVNVGGNLIVHVSLAGLLDAAAGTPAGHRAATHHRAVERLVVLADARGRLAITVDEVWGVVHHEAAQLKPVPPTLRTASAFTSAILGVDGHTVGYLDAARLMDALSSAIA